MATTFKDFIVECELYPYSQENFEIMKECSELALSEKFINNQMFLAENSDVISSDKIVFEEGFFSESIDSNNLEYLIEKHNAKSVGIIARIVKAAFKVFNTFAKFFGKIGNKFDPITVKGQKILTRLNEATLSDEEFNHIKKIIDTIKKADSSAFPIKKNQPFLKFIKFKYNGNDRQAYDELKNDLAVALSDKTVVAEALLNNKGIDVDMNRIGILDPDDIKTAGIVLATGKEKQLVNVVKVLMNSWSYIKKNGLVINVNTKSINKTAEELQDVCDKIRQTVSVITDNISRNYSVAKSTADAAANKTTDTSSTGGVAGAIVDLDMSLPTTTELIDTINKAVSILTSSIGLTTKTYIQLNVYRQNVVNQLYDFIFTEKNEENSTEE